MIDLIGHGAYGLISLGLLLLARDIKWGWPTKLVGDATFVWIGTQLAMSSIVCWGSVFVLLDIIGIVKWRKDANQDSERQGQGTEPTEVG